MSREMKDSGIEWIGEIPKEWNVVKLKTLCKIYTGNSISDDLKNNYADGNDAYPYITTRDLDVVSKNINYENGLYIKKNDDSFKIAKMNSVLLCIEGGSAGKKIAFTNRDVAFVNKLCCLQSDKHNTKFIYYYMSSPAFTKQFNLNLSGLIGGVSISNLKQLNCMFISPKEQQKIADYLDEKAFLIDNIIAQTTLSIEEYKKYKKSLITEIVTKGLNPDVEMKDSEIEWVGEIPKGWEIIKYKYILSLNSGDALTNDLLDDNSDYPVFGGGKQMGYYKNSNVNKNNMLIGRVGANCGCVTILGTKAWATDNALIVSTTYNKKYLYYLLLSSNLNDINEANAQPLITGTKVLNFKIPYSRILDEQQKIVDYLDEKCPQIDNLITQKLHLLKELESYKKSLIYECVTGKREVSNIGR